MNFLGKLLVCVTFFLCVLFMTFGLVANRTHRDLKAEADQLKSQVTAARETYDGLVLQQKRLDIQLRSEEAAALFQLLKLESEHAALLERNEALSTQLEDLKQRRADATEELAGLQQENFRLAEEARQLRADFAQNQHERQQAFNQTLVATEQLHQLQGQLENTLERRRDLRQDLGREPQP